ncbi:hypothetical protein OSTOST_06262 [Ostertagia ostertagi]
MGQNLEDNSWNIFLHLKPFHRTRIVLCGMPSNHKSILRIVLDAVLDELFGKSPRLDRSTLHSNVFVDDSIPSLFQFALP